MAFVAMRPSRPARYASTIAQPLFEISGLAMHHIYDETKKAAIVGYAASHNLRGLYLFGKPGRVVVEGRTADVRQYERTIRKMRWQKCVVMGRVATAFPASLFAEPLVRHGDCGPPSPSIEGAAAAGYAWRFDQFEEVASLDEFTAALLARELDALHEMLCRPFSSPSPTSRDG